MRTTCLVFLFARFLSVKPFPLSCSFNVTSQLCDYQVNYAENIAWDTDQDGDRAINYVKLIFKSVTLNVTIREGLDQTTCLSFGYYVTGSGSIRLVKRVLKDVEHNTELGYNVLFEVDQLKRLAAKWYFFNLTIPRLGPNNVFEFELKRLDDRSEARLSSLTTTQGDCVPKSNSCDFDHVNGFAADTCQLFSMNYTLPEYQWRITEPHGDYSRPEIDHSVAGQSGRFLSTEPTSEVPIGTEASLTLTKPVLGTTCLYFWYFRPQQIPLDNLTIVDNRGRRLWTANMSSYDWQRGQVEIAQSTTVAILSVKSTEMSLPAMIDDVALVGGPCAGVVTCSFRVDMCGWTIPKETLPWLQAAHITSRNFSSSSGEMFMYADTNQLEFEQFIMASDLVQTAGNFELTLETVNHVVGVCIFDIYTLSSDESSLIYRMPEDELNNTQWSITKIYFRYDGNFQIGIVLRSQLSDCFFAIRDLKLTQLVTNQQSEATFRTVAHDELSSQPNTFAPAAAVHFKNNCLLLVLMLSTSFLTLI